MGESDIRRSSSAGKTSAARWGAAAAAAGVVLAVGSFLAESLGLSSKASFAALMSGLVLVIAGAIAVAASTRRAPASPEEARGRRSTAMIGGGSVALAMGLMGVTAGNTGVGLVFALLGVGLLVGGLITRP